jgi:[acyl-carrier-protein] S-malonyltransferase
MIIVLAPGQGSQTPGFLEPWLDVDGVREHLGALSDASGIDLVTHGTVSDADTIRDTEIAQPLIVAASIVTGALLVSGRRDSVGAVAGHSVGEFAAAYLAGVLSDVDAIRLVGVRGRAMALEASKVATGMSAVLGGEPDVVQARLSELGLTAANMNGGGQVVVAGELGALVALAADPAEGTRVIPLPVAGAFHTAFMAGAVDTLRDAASTVTPSDPTLSIYTNRDGSHVSSGTTYLDFLIGQVSNPVRWDLCMDAFAKDGVTGIIELAPAGALVGLAKRGLKGIPSVAVKSPEDLVAAVDLLEAS